MGDTPVSALMKNPTSTNQNELQRVIPLDPKHPPSLTSLFLLSYGEILATKNRETDAKTYASITNIHMEKENGFRNEVGLTTSVFSSFGS